MLSPPLSLLASRAVTKTLCCLSYSVSPWCFVAKAANTDVCKVLGSILGPTASIIVGKTPALSLEASLALSHIWLASRPQSCSSVCLASGHSHP